MPREQPGKVGWKECGVLLHGKKGGHGRKEERDDLERQGLLAETRHWKV